MLGKMFSYDFKALSRILVPIHLALLLVGFVCAVAGFTGYASSEFDNLLDRVAPEVSSTIIAFAGITCIFCMLLMLSAVVATFVIILVRFYRNLFTDQGYLTLTLPLTAAQQTLSKVLAGMAWLLTDAVVVMGCLTAFSIASEGLQVSAYTDLLPIWILKASNGLIYSGSEASVPEFVVLCQLCLSAVMQMLFMLMTAYAAFCLGSAASARHKLAAGIGMFIGIRWVYGLVLGFFSVLFAFSGMFEWQSTMDILGAIAVIAEIAMIVGAWFVCVWVLKSKVNLA